MFVIVLVLLFIVNLEFGIINTSRLSDCFTLISVRKFVMVVVLPERSAENTRSTSSCAVNGMFGIVAMVLNEIPFTVDHRPVVLVITG